MKGSQQTYIGKGASDKHRLYVRNGIAIADSFVVLRQESRNKECHGIKGVRSAYPLVENKEVSGCAS